MFPVQYVQKSKGGRGFLVLSIVVSVLILASIAPSAIEGYRSILGAKKTVETVVESADNPVAKGLETLNQNQQVLADGQQALADAITGLNQHIAEIGSGGQQTAVGADDTLAQILAGLQGEVNTAKADLADLRAFLTGGGTGGDTGGPGNTDTGTAGTSGKTDDSKTVAVPDAPAAPATDSLEQIRREETTWWANTWYAAQAADWSVPQLPNEQEMSSWVGRIGQRVAALGNVPEKTAEYKFARALYDMAQALEGSDWVLAERHAQVAVSTGVLGSDDPSPVEMVHKLREAVEAKTAAVAQETARELAWQAACAAVQKDFDLDCEKYRVAYNASNIYLAIAQAAGVGENNTNRSAEVTTNVITTVVNPAPAATIESMDLELARKFVQQVATDEYKVRMFRGQVWNALYFVAGDESPSDNKVNQVIAILAADGHGDWTIECGVQAWVGMPIHCQDE